MLGEAQKAKQVGATRYCMGAAWPNPKERDMEALVAMVEGVKAVGMETCMTLGMLRPAQSESFAKAGLDYYNHNVDTSERYPALRDGYNCDSSGSNAINLDTAFRVKLASGSRLMTTFWALTTVSQLTDPSSNLTV